MVMTATTSVKGMTQMIMVITHAQALMEKKFAFQVWEKIHCVDLLRIVRECYVCVLSVVQVGQDQTAKPT